MNWRKINRKAWHDISRDQGLDGKAKKNLWELFKSLKSHGMMGLFGVTCVCPCGRDHELIMVIKDLGSPGEIGEKYKRDEKPKIMCPRCNQAALELFARGIEDPKMVGQLLGWENNPSFDVLPGQKATGVGG